MYSSTSAVMPGQTSATMPAPTETTPVNTHQPHELRCSRSRMARTIVIKPSAME